MDPDGIDKLTYNFLLGNINICIKRIRGVFFNAVNLVVKLNDKDRPTNLFDKILLCCQEDESYTFQLDDFLSYCQAVVTVKSIYNGSHVMLYELKLNVFLVLKVTCSP
jgi:hypothetical protein